MRGELNFAYSAHSTATLASMEVFSISPRRLDNVDMQAVCLKTMLDNSIQAQVYRLRFLWTSHYYLRLIL
jgi:hypothetical protein